LTKRVLSTDSRVRIDKIRAWASLLAGESRGSAWTRDFYICPEEVSKLARQIDHLRGGLIGLVGRQGVGKSSALIALADHLPGTVLLPMEKVLFKWRNPPQLYDVFFDRGNPSHKDFLMHYSRELADKLPNPSSISVRSWRDVHTQDRIEHFEENIEKYIERGSIEGGSIERLSLNRLKAEVDWAESVLGKRIVSKIRQQFWFLMVSWRFVILIDTPDYSKTDKRKLNRDLDEIYRLWNSLIAEGRKATIVIAVQKEMFKDHFFLDKMRLVELKPLSTEQILEGYMKQFGTFEPFTEDAIKLLAQMSRGIFRRFIKYIYMTLEDRDDTAGITEEDVRNSVSEQQLLLDNEEELAEIFPKSDQSRLQALKVMQFLETHSVNQKDLAEAVGISEYALSRILDRLELHHKIRREKRGLENIIQTESN
jgi:hypothetical protein